MAKKVRFVFGADLNELERGWKRIDYKMGKLSATMEKHGRGLTKIFTVPLMAVGGLATKAALDVEKAMQDIARGTGATGKALSDLQAEWKSLSVSVSQSFDVSSKALADYNTRLGLTGKALSGLSKQALDAGRMMGEDVSQLVAESAKAMQDWGVKSKETALFMDKVFLAAQNTGIGMSQLSTHMYKYGSALRQIGFDVDTTIAVLAQFEKQGVNTELVFGSLRISLSRMAQAGIKDAGEAFRLLTEDIKKTTNPVEATRKAIDLFGSKAGPDMAAAIREGRFEISDLLKVLAVAQGAIETNSDATKTFADRWSEAKKKVSLAIEPIGREILQLATDYMPMLEAKAGDVAKAISTMSEDTVAKVKTMALVLGAGGPLLLAMSAIVSSVKTVGAAFVALATGPAAPLVATGLAIWSLVEAWQALNDIMSANSQIQKKATGMTPAEAMDRNKFQAQAGEIFNERHGHYPLTYVDYKAVEAIVDELIKTASDRFKEKLSEQEKRFEAGKESNVAGTETPPLPNGNGANSGLDEWKASIEELWASLEGGSGGAKAKKPPRDLDQTWQIKRWENAQGFLGDEAYYAKLREDLDSLAVGSEAWRDRLTEVQAVAGQIASEEFRALSEKLDGGKISTEEFGSEVEALKAKFEGLPGVIRDLDKQTGEATKSDKWQMMSWENSQGLLGNEDYYARLKEELDALVVGSDAWRARFSEVQAIAGQMASVELTALGEKLEGGKLSTEEWKAKVEELKTKYGELPKVVAEIGKSAEGMSQDASAGLLDLNRLTEQWVMNFQDGMANAIVAGEGLTETLQSIGKEIASMLIKLALFGKNGTGGLLGGLFSGIFADGGVFSNGNVVPFARGGVVTAPTFFPMARGMGLMGEAGPEAVMPLKRGADGKLGVSADGPEGSGGTIINNYYIQAVDAQSFADVCRRNPGAITGVFAHDYTNNGVTRKVVQGR